MVEAVPLLVGLRDLHPHHLVLAKVGVGKLGRRRHLIVHVVRYVIPGEMLLVVHCATLVIIRSVMGIPLPWVLIHVHIVILLLVKLINLEHGRRHQYWLVEAVHWQHKITLVLLLVLQMQAIAIVVIQLLKVRHSISIVRLLLRY
jgi:hypothetical protein